MTTTTRWVPLRRRLLLTLLGGVSLCWLAAMVASFYKAHHEIDEMFDAQLVVLADTLAVMSDAVGRDDEDDDGFEMMAPDHAYGQAVRFQIFDRDGRLLLYSRNAGRSPRVSSNAPSRNGFFDAQEDGQWRYFSRWNREQSRHIIVGDRHEPRLKVSFEIASRMLLPALLGLPLLALWVWLATRRELAPLAEIARHIAERDAQRLDPVIPGTAPLEVRPLIEALNDLLARLDRALIAERQFTADAAHELRTPLAALAAQVEVAAQARDVAERDHALGQIRVGVDRAAHLVEQLLTLARVDAGAALGEPVVLRLDELLAEVAADEGAAAIDKNLQLSLVADAPALIRGHVVLLRILLRNLINNAIRYTPAGGEIALTVVSAGATWQLSISDSGPGIPREQREAALRRFVRLADDVQANSGSGLGLAIVARIAQVHGVRLELDDGLHGAGLTVRLQFDAVPPAPTFDTTAK
jgi:two-component system sensor histidine kinase QseC